jgi:hypothetical protein
VHADQAHVEPLPGVLGVGHLAAAVHVRTEAAGRAHAGGKAGDLRLVLQVDQQVVVAVAAP